MSTIAHTPQASVKRNRAGLIVTALVTLVVVAAAVLVLSRPGGSHAAAAPHVAGSVYAPLIQYHGTGAAPQPSAVQTSAPGHLRAEHSYGLVP